MNLRRGLIHCKVRAPQGIKPDPRRGRALPRGEVPPGENCVRPNVDRVLELFGFPQTEVIRGKGRGILIRGARTPQGIKFDPRVDKPRRKINFMGLREGLEGRVDLPIVDSSRRSNSKGRSEVSRLETFRESMSPPGESILWGCANSISVPKYPSGNSISRGGA